ncbi:MAG: DUF418 domain-containing protein [Planctomycetota bacterium]
MSTASTPSTAYRGVDMARGIALLGILFVNVRLYFWPLGVAIDPVIVPEGLWPTIGDRAAWSVAEFLCTYKFNSLFSILFGFALALQVDQVIAAGGSIWNFGVRRLSVLFLIGVTHGILIWYGDILLLYSVLGIVVIACARVPAKWIGRAILAIAIMLVTITAISAPTRWATYAHPEWFGLPSIADMQGVEDKHGVADKHGAAGQSAAIAADAPRGYSAMVESNFDIGHPVWRDGETAAYREGPFLDALLFRAVSYRYQHVVWLKGYGWHALTMMLFGLYALRTGLFGAEASARRRRMGSIALAVGLPLSAIAVVPFWLPGVDHHTASAWHAMGLECGGLVLPIAYATLLVEFVPRLSSIISAPLERAGRMGVTLFVCESICCTALANWWGFGWFGTMLDLEVSAIAVAVWCVMLLFATVWLRVFKVGPLEELWQPRSRHPSVGSSTK